jgi:hypothetical protein
MPRSNYLAATLAIACALACGIACSRSQPIGEYPNNGDGSIAGRDSVVPVSTGGTGAGADTAPTVFCKPFGQTCASGQDCCSGLCDPTSNTCAASINKCTTTGSACTTSTECCSLMCSAGRCSAGTCTSDNQACTDSASCCSGNCVGGACQALTLECKTAGNACTGNAQCCSKLCQDGVCKLGASFCIQTGDVCSDSSTCCSGDCKKGTGTLGTCAAPPSGATYCADGVDGTVCGDCNNCCSRLCAPYGPTGVRVCQPASGCRVNGDLCRKDSDCCGAAGTGLPGDGNVVCDIEVGKLVGICRNPRSCNPQGNVCHYKDYTCSVSSARNDCCAAVGNSGVCQLDLFGVPRCNGLGTTCRQGGETCSSMMDCCNQMPCVSDAKGGLHCWGSPGIDGGVPSKCVPSGGSCSVNADCCVGTTCIQPVGSTQGVCGIPVPPPSLRNDAGPPVTPIDASAPGCAEYGQVCTTTADCCNGVACNGGRCLDQLIF